MSWDKHHRTSFLWKNVLLISIKREISAVVHHDISLQTNKHHRTDSLQIAEPLESPAAIRSAAIRSQIQLKLKVQVDCHSFHFDLLLIISSSGLPTSFRDHLPHHSTTASHGSRNTSTRWDWSRIKHNDRSFKQCATQWVTAATQTPVSSPRRCIYSHRKFNPGRPFRNSM